MPSLLHSIVSLVVMIALGPVYIVLSIFDSTAAANLVNSITNSIVGQ